MQINIATNFAEFIIFPHFFSAAFATVTGRDNEELKEATLNANHLQNLNNLSQTNAIYSACMNFANDPLHYRE